MSSNDIPKETAELFEKFRKQEIKSKERDQLCAWIVQRKNQDPDWNLAEYLRSVGYDKTDWNRMKKQLSLFTEATGAKGKGDLTSTTALARKREKTSREDHFQTWWAQHEGVADIVLEFESQFAKMPGYFNKQLKTVDLEKAVRDAFEFFIRYNDMVTQLQEQKDNWEAFAMTLAKAHKGEFWSAYFTRLYLWWLARVQYIEAVTGKPLPQFVIDEGVAAIEDGFRRVEGLRVMEAKQR